MERKDIPPSTIEASPEINQAVTNQRKKRLIRRMVILTIIILIMVIPLLPRNKDENNPIIATIQDKPISMADIRNIALEQYLPSAVDRNALRISYEILIERHILDIEAKKLSLTVSNEEIEKRLKETRLDDGPVDFSIRISTKYDLLREKIIKTAVKSREAYSVAFYIASFDEQKELHFTSTEKALINKQRLVGKEALNQIEQKLRQGELPLHVAKSVFNQYPSLQPIIAVNGYIVGSTQEKALENPKLYTYDGYVEQPFFIDVYTMQPNEIKKVEEADGSGGYVIQVTSVNPSGENSYTDWLEKKKKELVKTNNYNI